MGQRVKPFTLFLCIVIFIYIIFGPMLICKGLNRPTPLELMKSRNSKWTGIIKIWHVEEYTICGKGSVEYWLREAIGEIEGRYPEVFFEIRSMTPDRLNMYFQEGMNRDILPDIISLSPYENVVPSNILENLAEYFSEEELNLLIQPAMDIMTDNVISGLPYMVGWYTFIVNTGLVEDEYKPISALEDVDWVDLHKFISKATCEKREGRKAIEQFGFITYNSPYSKPLECVADSHIERWISEGMAPEDIYDITYEDGWRIFGREKRAGVFLAPTKSIYTMRDMQKKGEDFQVYVLPIPQGTNIKLDQIGIYGLLKQDNDYKKMICIDFLKELLGEAMQTSLDEVGMFSVRRDITDIYDTDKDMQRLEEQLNGLYKYKK